MKRFLNSPLFVIVVTVVIVGFVSWAVFSNKSMTQGQNPAVGGVALNPFGQKPTPSPAPMTHEAATTTYYTLDLTYPKSSSSTLPEIFNLIQSQKQQFLANFDGLTPDAAAAMGITPGNQWNMIVTTEATTSAKTVSYIIQVYTYTGGAHGITDVYAFNYDLAGDLLTWTDVFKSDPNIYQALSTAARKYFVTDPDVAGQSDPDTLDDGTSPVPDNFSTWYITDGDIVFIFGQYQIGPYTLGIQYFPLDKAAASNILTGAY